MSKGRKRRQRRQRLAAHDAGLDRHNKGLSLMRKQTRARQRRDSQRPKPLWPAGTRVCALDDRTVLGTIIEAPYPNPGMLHVVWDGDDYVCVLRPDELGRGD